ncbi:hypothetical protein LIER_04659 [Lithospermum erythrorhizon]|uniref:Subtilisin-like protease fibronectin type-III domain-containing protein n=1 Tax=Lithospermum erythrorhizon TaxID=34254 RepID=A0AAV3P295_LITER
MKVEQAQLNYPTFAINITPSGYKTYTRTATNVGEAKETYELKVNQVPEVIIDVNPAKLVFTSVNKKITYQVTFTRNASIPASASYIEGAIVWSSVKHFVTTKISIQLF